MNYLYTQADETPELDSLTTDYYEIKNYIREVKSLLDEKLSHNTRKWLERSLRESEEVLSDIENQIKNSKERR